MQQPKKLNPLYTALIVIVLVGLVVTAAAIAMKTNDDAKPVETVTTGSGSSDTSTSTNSSSLYKDGTYTQSGRYISPGGAESIDVSVTIANNIITSAEVKGNASRGDAKAYQSDFIAGYKSSVVGKEVDSVSLSRVAGASLTSNGFNTALDAIKEDAQV
jgi:uncharacterized protein with FMN-binding domain